MKKILFMVAIVATTFTAAKAQTVTFAHGTSNPGGGLTNAGADTASATMPGYASSVGVQFTAQRLTGTAAGTAKLYGSIDGTNYVATGDSLVLANTPLQSVIWKKDTPVYVKYRVITQGSGSQLTYISVVGIQRKP